MQVHFSEATLRIWSTDAGESATHTVKTSDKKVVSQLTKKMEQSWSVLFLVFSGIICVVGASYGKMIGQLALTSHGVSGTVYAANNVTIVIVDFTFDGSSSDAVILIGKTQAPASDGTEVPVVRLGRAVSGLGAYDNDLLVLTVPGTEPISEYKYIAVWNRQNQGESYGLVSIPENFVPPAPYSLGVLTGTEHDFYSSNVIILDTKTVRFVGLTYDGQGPATFFWAGNTTIPDENGTRLIWKNTANQQVERSFQLELIDVTLPVGMTVGDIRYIGMWCEQAVMSFGHASIPEDIASLNVPPATEMFRIYDNCEVLSGDEMHVRWSIKGGVIDVELSGKIALSSFMGFGLSGSSSSSQLTHSDVTVTWMKSRTEPMVADYYYQQSQLQCSEGFGVCPDTVVKPTSGTDDSVLIAHSTVGGVTRISYSRYLNTGDSIDVVIPTNTAVFIVWVIGPVQDDGTVVFNRDQARLSSSMQINFGRRARDACPAFILPTDNSGNVQPAWPTLEISETQQLRIDIGPCGGSRGYLGITGKPAWKNSFYVDGLLVPVIKMQRNTTYVINVFSGNDPTDPINYNPLYLTSSPTGGYNQLSKEKRKNEVIYADKQAGPLCQYVDDGSTGYNFNSFEEYKAHLRQKCSDSVIGGRLVWTPDDSIPDTVYYQSYTHFGMGFKIQLSSSASDLTVSVINTVAAVVLVAMLD